MCLDKMTLVRFIPSNRLWLVAQKIGPLAGLLIVLAAAPAQAAPGDVGQCSAPFNISNSPGFTSADPFLLTDPAGMVYLFWAEKVTGEADTPPMIPDAVMVATWDGAAWSEPVDIFLSPGDMANRRIGAPQAVLDQQGVIHLVWIGPDFTMYYSSANAAEASSARAWRKPVLLASDQSGTQFSTAIAYEAPHTLHLAYASGSGGMAVGDKRTNRAISTIRSDDGGATWSEPFDIFTFSDPNRGGSNVRLITGQSGQVYATWTEWDLTGNGQVVYFARSLDSGLTWDRPVLLDEREELDYERDWTNLAVLDDQRLVALWEGGFRAYPQAQYSTDGGVSWTEPIDTFYWLIADNGFAQFVQDSAQRTHVFLLRRIREGFEDKCNLFAGCTSTGAAIWHSVWEEETRWREPAPLLFSEDNYLSAAISGGNQLTLAWSAILDPEIKVMHCQIEGAAAAAPAPLPTRTPTPQPEPTVTASAGIEPAPASLPMPTAGPFEPTPPTPRDSPAIALLYFLAPWTVVVALTLLITRRRRLTR